MMSKNNYENENHICYDMLGKPQQLQQNYGLEQELYI
jgi:hypothetical protein